MHMSLCEKYDALKAACKVGLSIRIESMIPTLACFKTNAGAFDSSEFNNRPFAVLMLSWDLMGTFLHFLNKRRFVRFVWIFNLSNEFCELIFMVLENGRHFNYFKFSCPCLDPRLCVVKYMKVNCFSDCWHCWRRDQWRHSLVPSHRRLLRRLLKHFVLAATSNFMILWIAILYT